MTNSESVKKSDVTTAKKKRATKEKADTQVVTESPQPKGRKPRASKIVTKSQVVANSIAATATNIILNLKCSMSELKEYNNKLNRMISNPLEYNSSAPPEVKYYDGDKTFGTLFQSEVNTTNIENTADDLANPFAMFNIKDNNEKTNYPTVQMAKPVITDEKIITKTPIIDDGADDANVNVKDMSAKLKQLKIQLYKNALHSEKKSACFWCTYDFDNPPCYIPKYEMDGVIYGYGSFCRPECAVAYLMKETIDDSTKFDRYHLLNQIYSKVYDCKKNIKPAPDPHYLLDKFYGNLNIQEYRRLLKTEHLLLVIDKPLTRILPELHEDTDDAFTKIYGIKATSSNSSGVYRVKRQSEQPQGPSKASIIKNTFGIST